MKNLLNVNKNKDFKNGTKKKLSMDKGVSVDAFVSLRPCLIKNKRPATFHCWGTFADEDGSSVNGVVEFEDGTCDWFPPTVIKFIDKLERIKMSNKKDGGFILLDTIVSQQDLADKLCEYCPLDKKCVYSVPGGFAAGCEGSKCKDAYDNYLCEMQANAQMLGIFQDLYDSEINFSISTLWDGGFDVKLGDSMNGFVADWTCDTMIQAAEFLKNQALIHFPDSTFSKKYA